MADDEEYPTTTYRGPQEYPVPEDWVLGTVEGDGIGWKRYPEADESDEHTHDLSAEATGEGPTQELVAILETKTSGLHTIEEEYWTVSMNAKGIVRVEDVHEAQDALAALMKHISEGGDDAVSELLDEGLNEELEDVFEEYR